MVKAVKNLKAWAKKSFHAVKKDPSIIERQMEKMKKRVTNVVGKGQNAYGKFQSGDALGGIKATHETYRAAVGGRKDDQMLKTSKGYKRAANIGSKTYKAATAFEKGDHEGGYKHAMDAARAAMGKAKLEQLQATKAGQHAVAAQHAFLAAKKAQGGGSGRGNAAMSGVQAYADTRKRQTQKSGALLGRNQ